MKHEQHSLAPLLQAIDREISERTQTLAQIERQLEALKGSPAAHRDDVARLNSCRSTERRELYRIEKELERLGVEFDAEHPREILVASIARKSEGDLTGTAFHSIQRER